MGWGHNVYLEGTLINTQYFILKVTHDNFKSCILKSKHSFHKGVCCQLNSHLLENKNALRFQTSVQGSQSKEKKQIKGQEGMYSTGNSIGSWCPANTTTAERPPGQDLLVHGP